MYDSNCSLASSEENKRLISCVYQSILLVAVYIPTAKQNLVSSVKSSFLGIGAYDIFLVSAHLLHSEPCAGIEALYLASKFL